MTTGTDARQPSNAYLGQPRDAVRETFERGFFARQLDRLLAEAPGPRVLELGCADGLVPQLAGDRIDGYVGVDLHPPAGAQAGCDYVMHDLSAGLGPVGDEPFDLYFASHGMVSHVWPAAFERLCRDIAAHARPGSLVALEALGLYSLEWPGLWESSVGEERLLGYRLADETEVHPWAPAELAELLAGVGIEPVGAIDRSVQAGPKVGEGRYWPGLPPVRRALNRLMQGNLDDLDDLMAPLGPLPAHPASSVHHGLVARRRELLREAEGRSPQELAEAVWALEPDTGEGFGHGLMMVGRAG